MLQRCRNMLAAAVLGLGLAFSPAFAQVDDTARPAQPEARADRDFDWGWLGLIGLAGLLGLMRRNGHHTEYRDAGTATRTTTRP